MTQKIQQSLEKIIQEGCNHVILKHYENLKDLIKKFNNKTSDEDQDQQELEESQDELELTDEQDKNDEKDQNDEMDFLYEFETIEE